MRAVNLVPPEARRGRGAGGRGSSGITLTTFGPAQFLVILLAIVVVLVLLRVLADNTVNNRKATLAAIETQVATEQAEAAKLNVYITFVQAAEQREAQVRAIAEQRFPWKRTFDQLSHALPLTTTLTSLSASTTATATTDAAGAAISGPTFTLAGCADTPNQNGTATLLRRLAVVSGVRNVGFQSSTRQKACGNSFNVVLTFAAPGASLTTGASTSAVPATTTTASTTATTTASVTTTASGTAAG